MKNENILSACKASSTPLEETFGGKAVGLHFNPSGDFAVYEIKKLYAQIINRLNNIRGVDRNEKARLISIAITEAQTAQMWAVKGITWND